MSEQNIKKIVSLIQPEDKPFSALLWETAPVMKIKGNPDKRVSPFYHTSKFIHATFYKSISKLL